MPTDIAFTIEGLGATASSTQLYFARGGPHRHGTSTVRGSIVVGPRCPGR